MRVSTKLFNPLRNKVGHFHKYLLKALSAPFQYTCHFSFDIPAFQPEIGNSNNILLEIVFVERWYFIFKGTVSVILCDPPCKDNFPVSERYPMSVEDIVAFLRLNNVFPQ